MLWLSHNTLTFYIFHCSDLYVQVVLRAGDTIHYGANSANDYKLGDSP